MKNLMLIFIATLILSFTSCDNASNDFEISSIEGTYAGTITSDFASKSTSVPDNNVIADVKANGDQLEVHLLGEGLDVDLILDSFENNDSIMVCLTGEDYKNMYGYMHGEGMMSGKGTDMDNMNNGNTEWMSHINATHNPGEEHFLSGFDSTHHTFNLTFKWQGNVVTFKGVKE